MSAGSASLSYSVVKVPYQHTPKLTILIKMLFGIYVLSFSLNIYLKTKHFYVTKRTYIAPLFKEPLYYTFIKSLVNSYGLHYIYFVFQLSTFQNTIGKS